MSHGVPKPSTMSAFGIKRREAGESEVPADAASGQRAVAERRRLDMPAFERVPKPQHYPRLCIRSTVSDDEDQGRYFLRSSRRPDARTGGALSHGSIMDHRRKFGANSAPGADPLAPDATIAHAGAQSGTPCMACGSGCSALVRESAYEC